MAPSGRSSKASQIACLFLRSAEAARASFVRRSADRAAVDASDASPLKRCAPARTFAFDSRTRRSKSRRRAAAVTLQAGYRGYYDRTVARELRRQLAAQRQRELASAERERAALLAELAAAEATAQRRLAAERERAAEAEARGRRAAREAEARERQRLQAPAVDQPEPSPQP